MSREKKALLYFAAGLRKQAKPYHWRLWNEALQLLPYPQDMPVGLYAWGPIAESLALSNFR